MSDAFKEKPFRDLFGFLVHDGEEPVVEKHTFKVTDLWESVAPDLALDELVAKAREAHARGERVRFFLHGKLFATLCPDGRWEYPR